LPRSRQCVDTVQAARHASAAPERPQECGQVAFLVLPLVSRFTDTHVPFPPSRPGLMVSRFDATPPQPLSSTAWRPPANAPHNVPSCVAIPQCHPPLLLGPGCKHAQFDHVLQVCIAEYLGSSHHPPAHPPHTTAPGSCFLSPSSHSSSTELTPTSTPTAGVSQANPTCTLPLLQTLPNPQTLPVPRALPIFYSNSSNHASSAAAPNSSNPASSAAASKSFNPASSIASSNSSNPASSSLSSNVSNPASSISSSTSCYPASSSSSSNSDNPASSSSSLNSASPASSS